MMVNLKSARELKPKNLNKEGLSLHSGKIKNHNSRNKVSLKFQYTNKQMILCNSKEKQIERKKLKQKNLPQIILKLKKKMISNLRKYNVNEDMYNKKIINDIIYDENKHIVSEFKNYLLWDENSDFLKRFYYLHESINRLPKINYYYEKYTLFPPVYFCLDDLVKIMIKNVKRKKKYLEMLEELEDNNEENNKKEEPKEFKNIINPKDVSATMTIDPSTINNYDKNSFSIAQIDINENNNNNLKDFNQIFNYLVNDNESILESNKIKKNNLSEEIKDTSFDIDNSLFDENINFNKQIKDEDLRGNITKKIEDSHKTIIPKIGKILEVKKLNFQNLNHLNNNEKISKKPNKININKNNKNKITSSDRLKKSQENIISLKNKKSIKKSVGQVQKMLINKKLNDQIPISARISNSKKQIKKGEKNKLNKSIEKMMKMIQYSKTSSRRETKTSKGKSNNQKKNNLEIQTNSKSKLNTIKKNKTIEKKDKNDKIIKIDKINNQLNTNSTNKKILVNKLLMTSPNFTPTETTPSSFITNNNITSSIYNINLNLNLGHTSYNNNSNIISNKSVLTKRPSNYTVINPLNKGNSVLNSGNKNIVKQKYYNIRNVIHSNGTSIPISNPFIGKQMSQYSNFFKTKNPNTERITNPQKDKISYDLNGNNVHISIQKQSINNTINHDNHNFTNSSVNININCNNNIENNSNNDKIYSRNDNFSNSLLTNLKSSHTNKTKKKLVIPLGEVKYSKSSRRLSPKKKKDKINPDFMKTINHQSKSIGLEKIKKKKNDKKQPLTSRAEKKNHDEIITKMLKKAK